MQHKPQGTRVYLWHDVVLVSHRQLVSSWVKQSRPETSGSLRPVGVKQVLDDSSAPACLLICLATSQMQAANLDRSQQLLWALMPLASAVLCCAGQVADTSRPGFEATA